MTNKEKEIKNKLKIYSIRNEVWDMDFLNRVNQYTHKLNEHDIYFALDLFGRKCFQEGRAQRDKEELEFLKSLQGVLRTNKESSMKIDNRIKELLSQIEGNNSHPEEDKGEENLRKVTLAYKKSFGSDTRKGLCKCGHRRINHPFGNNCEIFDCKCKKYEEARGEKK